MIKVSVANACTRLKMIMTNNELQKCLVPEFDPKTYKGLSSGIGKERRSSKHFKCTKPCCKVVKESRKCA